MFLNQQNIRKCCLKQEDVWLKCVQRKLDIAGTATEMHFLLFQLIKRAFQIPFAHFDHNRTIRYQF